ncbi:class I SAM-dependent methyltransferase [Aliifodinibius sp. S!AR15-10]|uniref:class I SAM-dependent methyltransferase n=1 Tax=Aliifodinibius sp. S!AR15-10 TaxID=2950437 RepID=UPI00285AE241|nr:class I SAM-dependent methyltransferase [Aliifodinibius sp. S!AR15-10]MDR8390481.1 class I SAM-dependent methyltransferase [Aliifodinibius sp. S!AR15-10]
MPQTNPHTGLISRLNAWMLHKGEDRYNQRVEERKRRIFSGLSGSVLEIGPGTGANLEFYPERVLLTGLEPNPHMKRYLKEKADKLGRQIEILTGAAEDIPLENESMDGVVSTLVLCSVSDLQQTLHEIKRVLKPGGTFLFMEHVAAQEHTFLRRIQRWIKPLWRRMAEGCRPDRETWKAIEEAGFNELHLEHFTLSLPVVGPHIMGRATKK